MCWAMIVVVLLMAMTSWGGEYKLDLNDKQEKALSVLMNKEISQQQIKVRPGTPLPSPPTKEEYLANTVKKILIQQELELDRIEFNKLNAFEKWNKMTDEEKAKVRELFK